MIFSKSLFADRVIGTPTTRHDRDIVSFFHRLFRENAGTGDKKKKIRPVFCPYADIKHQSQGYGTSIALYFPDNSSINAHQSKNVFVLTNTEVDRPSEPPALDTENTTREILSTLKKYCEHGPESKKGLHVAQCINRNTDTIEMFWGYCTLCGYKPQQVTFEGNCIACTCQMCQANCTHPVRRKYSHGSTCLTCGSTNIKRRHLARHSYKK